MPTSAIGKVARPWAVAQVPEPTCGLACTQAALRMGYQVQQTRAAVASAMPQPRPLVLGAPAPRRCHSEPCTQAIPVAISSRGKARRRQATSCRDRLAHTAMTTGSVPMIMVGNGTPASCMAQDSAR